MERIGIETVEAAVDHVWSARACGHLRCFMYLNGLPYLAFEEDA